MARNRAIDYIRQRNRQKFLDDNEAKEVRSFELLLDCEQVVAEDHETRMEKVKELIHALPPRQKEVFTLRFFEKKSAQETALLLGIIVYTVNKTYADAKKNLTEMVKKGSPKKE